MGTKEMIEYVTFLAETANNLKKEADSVDPSKPSKEKMVKMIQIEAKMQIISEMLSKFTSLMKK